MTVIDQTQEAAPRPPREAAPPSQPGRLHRWEQLLTGLLVIGPIAVATLMLARTGAHPPTGLDMTLAVALYLVTGHGITVGFHRLFTHRAFRAKRPLRIALAISGSMAYQGPIVGWVADHRRHHAFTDRPGDPHTPHGHRGQILGTWRGGLHAHPGWLFRHDPTDIGRYARDIAADRDLRRINALFPLWCVLSLGLPFAAGWVLGGTLTAGTSALLWAGIVRIAVLHQITWSINSICHLFGRRPYDTNDRSTNVAVLSIASMGESFHNNHHAFPRSARHGLTRGQLDSSGALIQMFERLGWATNLSTPRDKR
jgi:stearoyl-CoA desaturase (delta-9 desaturase)